MCEKTKYDDQAWEEKCPISTLKNNYDTMAWVGEGEWRQRNLNEIVKLINLLYDQLQRPVTILDIACFIGEYCEKLLEISDIQHKFIYTGMDVTAKFIDYANTKFKDIDHVKFLVGSAKAIQMNDNTFDIVFNSGMLIHVDDVPVCIKEFSRVSRHLVLIETTINHEQTTDKMHRYTNDTFLSYTYSRKYIEDIIQLHMTITNIIVTPYNHGLHSYLYVNEK